MTKEEDNIAFNQWLKDHGHNFPGMPKNALYQVYRSMDEENKREFLEEALSKKFVDRYGECLTIEDSRSEHTVFEGTEEECENYIESM